MGAGSHGHTPAIGGVLDGVVEKIAEDLMNRLGVAENFGVLGCRLQYQLDSAPLGNGMHAVQVVGQQTISVVGREFKLLLAQFDAGQRQQVGG